MDWNEYLAETDAKPVGIEKYWVIFEAWKVQYPEMSAATIARNLGIPIGATKDFVSQLNATEGNFDEAYDRWLSYNNRSRLRRVIRDQPDHENIAEIIEEEARLTELIANLKVTKSSGVRIARQDLYEPIAKLLEQEPAITNAQLAKRLGTGPNSIATSRSWLKKAGGNPVLAKQLKYEDGRTRNEERKRKAKSEQEWLASGIPD